jgi:hypothetical protein
MTDDAIFGILKQYGVAGLVLGLAAYALRYLHTQLVETLEKRVQDAQAFAGKVLALADEQHKQMATLTSAIEGSTDASHELRVVLERELVDQRRQPSAPRRPGG